jgi:hypothetical protein
MHSITATCFVMMCTKWFWRKNLGNCQRKSSYCMTTLVHIGKFDKSDIGNNGLGKHEPLSQQPWHSPQRCFICLGQWRCPLDDRSLKLMLNPSGGSWTGYAVTKKTFMLLASVTFQDNERFVSVKGEYLEKKWECGDCDMYVLFIKKIKSKAMLNHPNI